MTRLQALLAGLTLLTAMAAGAAEPVFNGSAQTAVGLANTRVVRISRWIKRAIFPVGGRGI